MTRQPKGEAIRPNEAVKNSVDIWKSIFVFTGIFINRHVKTPG